MFFNSCFAGVFYGYSTNLGFPRAVLVGCCKEMTVRVTLCSAGKISLVVFSCFELVSSPTFQKEEGNVMYDYISLFSLM